MQSKSQFYYNFCVFILPRILPSTPVTKISFAEIYCSKDESESSDARSISSLLISSQFSYAKKKIIK